MPAKGRRQVLCPEHGESVSFRLRSRKVGVPSCSSGCPGGIDIPAYLDKIREGDVKGAARTLLDANPFPAITGRVCPHFCEQGCVRNAFDEPLSIRPSSDSLVIIFSTTLMNS